MNNRDHLPPESPPNNIFEQGQDNRNTLQVTGSQRLPKSLAAPVCLAAALGRIKPDKQIIVVLTLSIHESAIAREHRESSIAFELRQQLTPALGFDVLGNDSHFQTLANTDNSGGGRQRAGVAFDVISSSAGLLTAAKRFESDDQTRPTRCPHYVDIVWFRLHPAKRSARSAARDMLVNSDPNDGRRRERSMRGTWPTALASVAFLLIADEFARAQDLLSQTNRNSTVGATPGLAPLPQSVLRSRGDATAPRHLSPAGRLCLLVLGESRHQAINTRMFEHMVSASNSCAENIRLEVCYYGSQRCIPMSVPGYSRREALLGVMLAIQDFRFEFKERFY